MTLARVSSDPLVTLETSGAKARVSAAPLDTLSTGGAKARVSAAPLLILQDQRPPMRLSAAPLLVLFGSVPVVTTPPPTLKPYLGFALGSNTIYKADTDGQTDDDGTPFQAYEDLRPIEARPGYATAVGDAILLAPVAQGVTITATATADWGLIGPRSGSGVLTATGAETRKSVRLEGSGLSDASIVTYRIGDAAPISNAWSMDRLIVPVAAEEGKSA